MHEHILTAAKSMAEDLTANRRWLHSHAEVGFDLTQTLEYVGQKLTEIGCTPVKCGKAGICVVISGSKPGKTILLRADMDALPIHEEADVPFACKDGRMHACGHDMHTAMLLGAAKLLMENRDAFRGHVKLMFQPAEEIFEGSANMLQNGILKNPDVDAAIMIHVTAGMPVPAGTVIVSAGGVSAPAGDYFSVHVQGKGCHGSAPQNGIDALTAASHIVIALQELHARELASTTEAILTVGTMRAGTADNVIADTAVFGGTIRTYDEETRVFLKKRLEEISVGIAAAFRAEATVRFGSGCPTLLNNEALSQAVQGYLTDLLGKERTISAAAMTADGKPARGGGSEDFAYISHAVPSLMLALAAGEPDKGFPYPQHHPKVKFDESVLPIGAAVYTDCAIQYLNNFSE